MQLPARACGHALIDGSIASFHQATAGITSPCCLLIGQYSHHMTLLPSNFYGKKCYGIRLYQCCSNWFEIRLSQLQL